MKYEILIEETERQLKRYAGFLEMALSEMNNKKEEYNQSKENYLKICDRIKNLTSELEGIKVL